MTGTITLALCALPLVLAVLRGHRNWLAIAVLNIVPFAVWVTVLLNGSLLLSALVLVLTAVPWFIALVWSCTSNTRRAHRRNVQQVQH